MEDRLPDWQVLRYLWPHQEKAASEGSAVCQLPGEGDAYSMSASGFWGFGLFLKEGKKKKKSGGEQESTGSILLGKSVSDGVWYFKKQQESWWRILK